jgi:hypothetical protein
MICFVTSCAQTPDSKKLIDEINASKAKAWRLVDEAESKRKEAREKNRSGEVESRDALIEEAAKLYRQASNAFQDAAKQAKELSKVQSLPWYEQYFSLHSKLLSNRAYVASDAHEELLVRKSGSPSESQVQSWTDDLKRIEEEDEELLKQIVAIEKRQGVVLIKE